MSAAVPATPPFRLDYTVAALQRVATNPVEVWTKDVRYLRAFATRDGPVVWEVTQREEDPSVRLRLHGPAGEARPWKELLRRMLGTDRDLRAFYAVAARIPVLAGLVRQFRGLKPPRFATLWESLVNTIAFQQLSLVSGMATLGRLARRCARPVPFDGEQLYPFPGADAVDALADADLRACGFSAAKARSLKSAANAILSGALREDELEHLPDSEVVGRLSELPGVGPWTSSLILLRGMGRLDVFPVGDAGALGGLRRVFAGKDPTRLLATLGEWRGMLYFHLLLSSRFARAGGRARRRTSSRTPARG